MKSFFKENSLENHIELCAFENILKYFYIDDHDETMEYKKSLRTKNVFVDELLWPYAHFAEKLYCDDDSILDSPPLITYSSSSEDRYSDIVAEYQDLEEREENSSVDEDDSEKREENSSVDEDDLEERRKL